MVGFRRQDAIQDGASRGQGVHEGTAAECSRGARARWSLVRACAGACSSRSGGGGHPMRVLVMARSSRSGGSDYPVCVGPCTLSGEHRAVLGMVRTASGERRAGASPMRARWLGGGHRGRWARVLLECGDGPDVVDCPATPHSTDGASAFAERDAAAAVRQCAATALPELSLDELSRSRQSV